MIFSIKPPIITFRNQDKNLVFSNNRHENKQSLFSEKFRSIYI